MYINKMQIKFTLLKEVVSFSLSESKEMWMSEQEGAAQWDVRILNLNHSLIKLFVN